MAEEASKVDYPQPPPFLEVRCKSSGKMKRFAEGTKAGFAVSLINRKLDIRTPVALHIEAVKEGEEPISFGPDAALVNFGNGWMLQTVTEADDAGFREGQGVWPFRTRISTSEHFDSSRPSKRISQPVINFFYIGKIFLAFLLLFFLGGFFTLALENLPRLILFINSYM
ncbi:hypothetical protein CFOL_v3_31803 [Cephalotus follicularis]|uniref:Uncharacterized protein n=1 Tax=Cephalotus follicularis TaxID=3775 RepID=A0A1Q3D7D3_CEPFO|nr:hypothetical protein CFOL_v3_31803 [Cephalotus follicularis]